MNPSLKISAALLVNFSLLCNEVAAQLPQIDFNSYVPGAPIDLTSPDGWESIYGDSSVTAAGQGFGGSGQALKIGGNPQEEAWLRKPVTWNAAESIAFIDFRIKPAATATGSQANFLANGTQLAFQLPSGSTNGELWVLHGNDDDPGKPPKPEKWYQTAGKFTVPAGSAVSTDWVRATLRHDYGRKVWDLFINDKLAAVNLGFEGRGANLTALEFFGSLAGDTLIDNLEANPSNMLFPDADKDGLPDAWETANGSNPNLYDRDAINPVTGKSFLDGYLASLWNAQTPGQAVNGATGAGNIGIVPPLTILAAHQPVGAVKGQFAVGGDGAATYTIPLDLPKGRAGMEPKISLNYSSNGGSGPMGVGWSIGGLQKITRGPSSHKKDGIADGADFDGNDRFFLDGERMVCISGTYGLSGSEYRTEMDSFARIKANGTSGLAPSDWTIETKSGLKVTLGASADSRVKIGTSGVLSWLVNEVVDTTGRNAYRVDYRSSTAALAAETATSRYPWRIRYTIDPANGNDTGFCSMTFVYGERSDDSSGYVRGTLQEAKKRLDRVELRTGTYLNHAYNLSYLNSQQTGRSLLIGVDKEASNGSRVPATTFEWDTLTHAEAKWQEVGQLDFNEYGSGQDSSSSMASFVSVNGGGTELHLTGNAWRSYPLAYSVTANTRLTFLYKTTAVAPKWGMIGLDENTSTANPKRLFKLVGGAYPPVSTYSDSYYQYSSPGNWQLITINIGQNYTGLMNFLALVNDDNTTNDGVGESWFKDIRIYEHPLDPANVAPRVFDQEIAAPRILDGNNEDLGVRIQDLNGDGLPDIAYNLLHSKSTANGPVTLNTFGQVLLNTGSDFVNSPALKLPPGLPTATLPGGGEGQWSSSQAIIPKPVDIDGNGQLDYAYARNLNRDSSSTFTFEHGYMTRNGSAWVDLPAYTHHFKSTCATSQKRFSHFEHVDLDSDGDLDVVVHPYGATLNLLPGKPNSSPATFPLVGNSGSNSGIAYLNKFDEGLGWVISPAWALKAPLRIPGFSGNGGEVGRGLQDLDGDGKPDMYSALWQAGKSVWLNNGAGWDAKDGGSIYQVPENITNSSGDDVGTRLVDVNGDGHIDVLKALGSGSMNLNVGVNLNTGNGWLPVTAPAGTPVPWLPEETFNTVDKRGEVQEQGTSFTDLNADGLADFVVSKYTRDTVFFNTGSGWWAESNISAARNDYWATPEVETYAGITTGKWQLPSPIYPNTVASTEGIRHAMLVDLNGDGISDLIGEMKNALPRVWINQAKPERIISVTDGFGAYIEVNEYKRINDPTPVVNGLPGTPRRVYDRTPVSALLEGHVSLQDSRWVVARYSEPDGSGGRRYRSQYYGDLRYDKKNEASLGFGVVEVHDELTKGYSRTQTRRDYPFAGSPDVVDSFAWVSGPMPHQPGISIGHHPVSQDTATYGSIGETTGLGSINGAVHKVRRPVQLGSVSKKWDLGGTLMSHVVTSQVFASHGSGYGFVQSSTVTSMLDGSATTTANLYTHNVSSGATGKWHLGRLTSATVIKSAPSKPTLTKTSSFTYDPGNGLLKSETVQPGTLLFVEKTYGHDPFGNVTSTAVRANKSLSPVVEETRTASTTYDSPRARFPVSETNAVGSVSFTYSQNRAVLLSTTDLDDRKTTFTYDPFGTKLATNYPDNTRSAEITRFVTNSDLPSSVTSHLNGAELRWARSAQASATPWATVYFDSLGREIVTESVVMSSASGSPVFSNQYTVTLYDNRGRKEKTSTPFLAGESPYWTHIEYDVLDRPVKTVRPDLTFEGIDHTVELSVSMPGGGVGVDAAGIAVVTLGSQPVSYVRSYNAKGNKLERWTDQHGRMIYSRDASGQITSFVHDVEGRVTSVSIDGTAQVGNVFDLLGNKTSVTDLSGGNSTSVYNGFGEVKSITTPLGTTTQDYDSAGRLVSVTRPNEEAASPATVTYTTIYNPAKPGKGKPWYVNGPGGYQEVFDYGSATHDYGKLKSTAKLQKSGASAYISTTDYNALGLVMSETFSGDAATSADDVQIAHDYDSVYGSYEIRTRVAGIQTATLSEFVSVVRSGDRIISTAKLAHDVQRITETDARNGRIRQITSTRLGQTLQNLSYAWDNNGNLTSRTDSITGKTESFAYDTDGKGLDRLASSTVAGQSPLSYSYDTKGNLTGKGGNSNTYTGYRVTSATIKGQVRSYSYGAAGHVLADGKRTYTWTAFGQLKSVTQTSTPALETFAATGTYAPAIPGIAPVVMYEASHARSDFEFDAAGTRAQQVLVRTFNDNSAARVITRYLGSYELEEHATRGISGDFGTVKRLHRHRLGGALFSREVPVVNGNDGPPVARLAVVLTDHIGSTDVIVRADWDTASGAWKVATGEPSAERQSFDAWGERRQGADWTTLRTTDTAKRSTSTMDHDRGFTGHEMLDDFGLVHMNGRIYDSELGRFLSPDPYVQVPEYSQNFNRYSYVLNNPLSYTDPTGNEISGIWAAIIVIVVIVVVTIVTFGTATAAASAWGSLLLGSTASAAVGSMATAAVGGAFLGGLAGSLNAALAGGDFGDILRGGIIGGIQGGITAGLLNGMSPQGAGYEAGFNAKTAMHVAGHGIVGGSANSAMGGKFQDGFLSGAVSAAAADAGAFDFIKGDSSLAVAGRTAVAGIVGGTSSAIGGGKFANGAYTSAFQNIVSTKINQKNERNGNSTNRLSIREVVGRVLRIPRGVISLINLPGNLAIFMRQAMISQSLADPMNSSGVSVGFKGDRFKLGGSRFDPSNPNAAPGPLGGDQGGPGSIFGIGYKPGSLADRFVEAYAGPHDYFNDWMFYDKSPGNLGNVRPDPPLPAFAGETLNALNVVFTTPLVVFSLLPTD